jgi:hypothetical protein
VLGGAASLGAPGALRPPRPRGWARRLESGTGPARASRPARRVVSPGVLGRRRGEGKGQLAGGPWGGCATARGRLDGKGAPYPNPPTQGREALAGGLAS